MHDHLHVTPRGTRGEQARRLRWGRRRPDVDGAVEDLVSHLVDAVDTGAARFESVESLYHCARRAIRRRSRSGFTGQVLWVDDHPDTIEPLLAALRRVGVAVHVVSSTKEAIDAVFTVSYAAVISDMRREEGGVDHPFAGVELARALEPSASTRPMLVFTGPRGMQHEDELRDAGVHAVTSRASVVIDFVTDAAS